VECEQNGRATAFFIDVYSTSYYQNVTSGGLKAGGAFVQNT
jgi:hypothetical protein